MTSQVVSQPQTAVTRFCGHPVCGWLAMAGLVLLEWILFRRFLLREVVWAYPPDFDQAAYLRQAYELYERIRTAGVWQGITHQPDAPQGAFLQLQAALLFDLLGHASRFIALSLNFFYFALFQIALFGTLRWLAKRWSVAFLSVGLLMMACTTFNTAGGIYDFRMDFTALCLYGTFLCCVIRSGVFAQWGWSLVAGLCGALLVCFRFITATYLIGLLAIIAMLAMISAARGQGVQKRDALRQLRGTLIAGLALALLAGPVLWSRRAAIHDYYVVNHVTGAEKEVRAAETGTTQLFNALIYYPTSLRREHAGNVFLGAAVFALLIGAAVAFRCKRKPGEVADDSEFGNYPLGLASLFVGVSLLLPLAILTSDISKSPVVGGILVSPLLWLVMLGFVGLTKTCRRVQFPQSREIALAVLAAMMIGLGITVQARSYAHIRLMRDHRRGVQNIAALSDLIAEKSNSRGWRDVAIFNDTVADYLNVQNVEILAYERHGYILKAGDQFGSLLEIPEAQVFKRLRESHFAILTRRIYPPPPYDYPIDLELDRLHPQLEAICRHEMALIAHYRIFDRNIDLYMRR